MPSDRLTRYSLFFVSGGAALGYQLVWVRMFALQAGHEMPAVLAVVTAVLGGMALGAGSLDGVLSRSPRPGRWYGGLEVLIGLWSCLVMLGLPLAGRFTAEWTGLEPSAWRQWGMALAFPSLLLLPATLAMGATFPAMERWLAPAVPDGRCVGGVYAANTLGAVTGTLLGTFVLMPALGLSGTALVLVFMNLLCGLTALGLDSAHALRRQPGPGMRRRRRQEALASGGKPVSLLTSAAARVPNGTAESIQPNPDRGGLEDAALVPVGGSPTGTGGSPVPPPGAMPTGALELSRSRLAASVFTTGLLGIGYEVVGVRVLSQVLENTVYTFGVVLAVYLLGTAAGAGLYQGFGQRLVPRRLLTELLGALALTCLCGMLAMNLASPLYDGCREALGNQPFGVALAEFTVALAVFGLPTVCMGATFSLLVQASRRPDGGVGRAVAINTVGGALAGGLFGFGLLPLLGSRWTLTALALAYLVLLPNVAGWRWSYPVLAGLLALVLPRDLRVITLPPGGRLVDYREGIMASVAVVEDAARHRVLRVNNRFQMGGTAAANAEYRQAHLPLLLHPGPRHALFLGTGTGITLGAATLYADLHCCGVELLPEVAAMMPWFEPQNLGVSHRPGVTFLVADARRVVSLKPPHLPGWETPSPSSGVRGQLPGERGFRGYDVIVADLFHPARDGAGALYTLEHFKNVAGQLERGGLFCQWLPLHQLDDATLRLIVRTFQEVFPDAQAWLLHFNVDVPVLGLLGRQSPFSCTPTWLEDRVLPPETAAQLKSLALGDTVRLLGHLLAGPAELRRFAGEAPVNTDDRPRVMFAAPRFAYDKSATPYGRLLGWLALPPPDPGELLGLGAGPEAQAFSRRLRQYLQARNRFLHGLVDEAEGRSAAALAAYIDSARLSEDFTPGYAQCLTRASLLTQSHPAEARALLERLVAAQPGRPVARQMLERLEAVGR